MASTKWDESNKSKIMKIGQLEAEIFAIVILIYTKKKKFFSIFLCGHDSLKYVKFINLPLETMLLGSIGTS